MRPPAILIATAALLWVCAAPGAAHAQDWQLAARATATTGVSDNILNRAESTDPAVPGRITDVFYQVQPAALADYASPRTRHRLTYAFNAFFYQDTSGANSTSHHVAWLTRWLSTPRSDVSFEVSGDLGKTSTVLFQAAPDAGGTDLLPVGELSFRAARARQRYNWRATKRIRLGEQLSLRTVRTFVADEQQTEANEIALTLSGLREWNLNAIGLEVELSLLELQRLMTDVQPDAQSITQLDITTRGRWRRTFSRRWVGVAVGGVAATTGPSPRLTDRFRLVAELDLQHRRTWGGAAFTVGHSVTPNLFVARKTVNDFARLRAWLPLPWLKRRPIQPTLVLASSATLQRGRGIDIDAGNTTGGWTSFLFDLGLSWQALDNLAVSLRYTHLTQDGDTNLAPDYSRNTVMLSVQGDLGTRRQVRHRLSTGGDDERTPGTFTEDN